MFKCAIFIVSAQCSVVLVHFYTAPEVQSEEKVSTTCFLVVNLDIILLSASFTLMYPSLASCPQTAPAASVVIATALFEQMWDEKLSLFMRS